MQSHLKNNFLKILFICASVEPGKDGVGDYTRKLAGELCKQNNSIKIIALNERYLQEPYLEYMQTDENVQIPVLRVSKKTPWNERLIKAKTYIEAMQPDWISFQYVPYGFNKKGIPFYLPDKIKQLANGTNWHIMFHEMWIGISSVSPIIHKLYGFFQKQIALSLIKKIHPKKITTTNFLYQAIMRQENIMADVIPLFSNIPVANKDMLFLRDIESKYNIRFNEKQFFIIGVFGTLYPSASLPKVLPSVIESVDEQKKVVIIFFGRNSHPKELHHLKNVIPQTAVVIELGELPADKVSSVFSILREAVLCTPVEHIGKSGVYAALRLHNVKVSTPASQPIPRYAEKIKEYAAYLQERPSQSWDVNFVADEFIKYLQQ